MSGAGIFLAISNLGIMPLVSKLGISEDDFCHVRKWTVKAAWTLGLHVSTLVETLIAAIFTASVQRWQRVLSCLTRLFPVLWVIGFVMTLLNAAITTPIFDARGFCKADSDLPRLDMSEPLFTLLFGMATTVNFFMYAVVMCKHFVGRVRQPFSVETRQESQMMRYFVVFVFTWLPYWLVVFFSDHTARLFTAKDRPRLFASVPISLNGVTNVWAYAAHSRRLRRVWQNEGSDFPSVAGPDHSFSVHFQHSVDSIPRGSAFSIDDLHADN